MSFGRHHLTRSDGQPVVTSADDDRRLAVLVRTLGRRLPPWAEAAQPQPCDALITICGDEPQGEFTRLVEPRFEHVSFASEGARHPANATIAVTGDREHLDSASEAMAFLLSSEQVMVALAWSDLRALIGSRQTQVQARCWVEPGPVTDDSARALGWRQNALTAEGWGRAAVLVGLVSWPDLAAFDLETVETLQCINFCHLDRNGDGLATAAAGARQSAAVLFAFR